MGKRTIRLGPSSVDVYDPNTGTFHGGAVREELLEVHGEDKDLDLAVVRHAGAGSRYQRLGVPRAVLDQVLVALLGASGWRGRVRLEPEGGGGATLLLVGEAPVDPGAPSTSATGKRPAVTFPIPPGTSSSPCRGCGAAIYWIRTAKGSAMPVNRDGTSHFGTCPKAGSFSRKGKDRKK